MLKLLTFALYALQFLCVESMSRRIAVCCQCKPLGEHNGIFYNLHYCSVLGKCGKGVVSNNNPECDIVQFGCSGAAFLTRALLIFVPPPKQPRDPYFLPAHHDCNRTTPPAPRGATYTKHRPPSSAVHTAVVAHPLLTC